MAMSVFWLPRRLQYATQQQEELLVSHKCCASLGNGKKTIVINPKFGCVLVYDCLLVYV